jgi:glutamate synthase (NADPH/NADH) large chain
LKYWTAQFHSPSLGQRNSLLASSDYWKEYLKNLVSEHFKETESQLSKKIIENFEDEVNNFVQVCPKEMLDKLKNPITLKKDIKKVS